MMKRLVLLIAIVLSAGCVQIVPIASTTVTTPDPSEALFVQVLEEEAPRRAEALAELERDHSQSPWALRAKKIEELRTSRDALTDRIRNLERRNNTEVQKNRALEKELNSLRNDLEKLKQIIIEMEQRSRI